MARAAFLLVLAILVAALAGPSHGDAQPRGLRGVRPPPPLPPVSVRVAIVEEASGPAADTAWLAERFENARALLATQGVSVTFGGARPLAGRHAELHTRRDRSALARELERGVVNVFVVRVLRDVDEVGFRQGVHWHVGPLHYVIVTSTSGPTTLCHELGHFFGLGHSDVRGNIMSYDRGSRPPFFDDAQGIRMRARARALIRRRELRHASS